MRNVRTRKGPFQERPYFKLSEIEQMCSQALSAVNLLPQVPEPIRIDRFVEKHFKISPTYEDLPAGVLGFTRFGSNGVAAIVLSNALEAESSSKATERRIRTTLAHEAGHGLMHAHLFCLGTKPISLFEGTDDTPKILCRDVPGEGSVRAGYDNRWWEFQANKAIGGFLMPRSLVEIAAREFASPVGSFGAATIEASKREGAIRAMAEIFDVNPAVVRIRLEDVFPLQNEIQMSL